MTTPRTLTVRTPEDVLALVVSVLGFQPSDSVVMVTRTAAASFHARADLPLDQEEVLALAEHLAEAATVNQAQEAIIVTYSGDRHLCDAMTAALAEQLGTRGIDVDLAVREHAGRWYRAGDPFGGEGFEYDLTGHPFVLECRFLDREIYRDRAELASSLRGPTELVTSTERALAQAAQKVLAQGAGGASVDGSDELGWALERVVGEDRLSPDEIARLALDLGVREIRDGLWLAMDRATAADWRRRLKEIVRATPDDLVAEPAGLLAFASWLSGDGALAWCAVDLVRTVEPDHTLASLVAQALEAAVPPSAWDSPTLGTTGPQTV
jgi:hypothetical protein